MTLNRSHSTPGLIESTGKVPLEDMQLSNGAMKNRDSPSSLFTDDNCDEDIDDDDDDEYGDGKDGRRRKRRRRRRRSEMTEGTTTTSLGGGGGVTTPHITLGTTCSNASFVTDSSVGRKSTLPASPSYFKHSPTPSILDGNTMDVHQPSTGQSGKYMVGHRIN